MSPRRSPGRHAAPGRRPLVGRAGRLNRARFGLVTLATAVCAVMSYGIASAFWTNGGEGAGSAKAGTLTLTASVTGVSGLYPGDSIPVTVDLTNTSGGASISIQSVAAGDTTIGTRGKGTCDAHVVTFAVDTTKTSLPSDPVAHGAKFTVNGIVSMASTAADGCQGTSFSIPLTATGKTS